LLTVAVYAKVVVCGLLIEQTAKAFPLVVITGFKNSSAPIVGVVNDLVWP